METLTAPVKATTEQQINLIDGSFTVNEAADIIKDVLFVKINFHKLHRLAISEGDNTDPCEFDNSRINELIQSEKDAKEFFQQMRKQGKRLKIKSTINISIED